VLQIVKLTNFLKLLKIIKTNKHLKRVKSLHTYFNPELKVLVKNEAASHIKYKRQLTQLNPEPPKLKAFIKIHKQHNPIRPVVSYTHAPAYKVAGFLANFLKEILALPNKYDVKNSVTLIEELKQINLNPNSRLCSFDTDNMYPNIPKLQVMDIINNICCNMGIMANVRQWINILVKAVLEQNYFAHNNIIYQKMEGLTMGAPTSSIFSEVFVQYLEHTQIAGILTKYAIAYHRYVDYILIIYNNDNTNIEHLLSKFNGLHTDMQFTIETEI
jgi:hypothetical protein